MQVATIGRATLALAVITMGVKLLGFVEKQVIAYYFGADARVDAFFVALSVPTAVFLLVREIVEPAFLPLFVKNLDAGRRQRAWQLFTAVGAGVVVVTLPIVAAGFLGAGKLASWLAPGFAPPTLELTAVLVRVTIAGGLLLGLSSLTYITLNGYRRFALPATGDLVMKAALIVCAVVLASRLGAVALAIGVLVGCAGRLAVHLAGLARELRWLAWPRGPGREEVRRLAWLMAPLVVGVVFSQLSELADNYFSSLLGPGAVAARSYARKIVDLPILLLPYALSVVAFPYFSALASRREWDRLYAFFGRTLRGLALVFALLSVATILLAEPVVAFLLERGAFDAHARVLTAWPLRLYAVGLVSFALEALLVPFYFALGDTRTPVLVGILGVFVNVALTAALIGPFGVGGVALALTLSKTLKVVLLGAWLKRKRPALRLAPALGTGLRLGLAAGVAAAGIGVSAALWEWPGAAASLVQQAGYLAFTSAAGAVLYLAAVLGFGSPERSLVIAGWSAVSLALSRRTRETR